jgi:hypothetical protein
MKLMKLMKAKIVYTNSIYSGAGQMANLTLRTYDLNPDGVRIVVDWSSMVVGSSVFVPCINTDKALQQIKRICVDDMEWDIRARSGLEGNFSGVRVWRLV